MNETVFPLELRIKGPPVGRRASLHEMRRDCIGLGKKTSANRKRTVAFCFSLWNFD